MWVRSLGQEDPLEVGMATHPSILAGRIPWTEEPGEIWSTGSQRIDTAEAIQHACNAMKILHAATKTQLSQINKY